ncbi:MAG: hypothetical protein R3224_04545, partial [Balneolaceae bacterium]|nr:hypothetical protein [Balneolaceae bacterium]
MKRKATNRKAHTLRTCPWIVGIAILFFGITVDADAQYYTSSSNELVNNSYYSVQAYSGNISELSQLISIQRQRTPLKDILEEIAHKSDLGIAYNAELDFLNDKMNVDLKLVTVGSALTKLLAS